MNRKVTAFLKIGKEIAKAMIPGIAAVEEAITAIKDGKDKRKAVIAMTKGSLQAIEGISEKDIANVDMFEAGLSEINEGFVKVLNSLKKDSTSSDKK